MSICSKTYGQRKHVKMTSEVEKFQFVTFFIAKSKFFAFFHSVLMSFTSRGSLEVTVSAILSNNSKTGARIAPIFEKFFDRFFDAHNFLNHLHQRKSLEIGVFDTCLMLLYGHGYYYMTKLSFCHVCWSVRFVCLSFCLFVCLLVYSFVKFVRAFSPRLYMLSLPNSWSLFVYPISRS